MIQPELDDHGCPGTLRPNLLCTVPPFSCNAPPAGAASLLGYLKAHGCDGFDFLDLQLWQRDFPLPYSLVGAFGESFVRDVPELPLVLRLLRAFEEGRPLAPERDEAFDAYCQERALNPAVLSRALAELDSLLTRFVAAVPRLDFVGFTVWSSNYLTTLLTAAHLKRRPKPPFIVMGGPQVTESENSARLALRSGLADVVALSEGEQTLLELYEAWRTGRPTRGIAGTMWMEDDGSFARKERPLLRVRELPLPAFEKMPVPSYQSRGMRILPHQLSRGCTGACSFCSEWGFWRSFRPDSAEHALEQAEQLRERFGAQFLQFTDSLLNGHFGRLVQFAEGLLERGLGVRWGGFMRPDMDLETARLLARAGFAMAFVGIESLDDATLGLMQKRATGERGLGALEGFLQAGIEVQAGVIPGFPGDSRASFLKIIQALLGLRERYAGRLQLNVEPFVVSPGQPIFRELERHGLSPVGWDERVLDTAPKYRDIAERIVCRVEGANQGMERLGQLRLVSVWTEGKVAPAGIDFEELTKGWLLASGGAAASGLLVNEDERRRLESLAADREALAQEARRVGERHVALPSGPAAAAGRFRLPLEDEDRVALSPLALARRATLEQGEVLLAFDLAVRRLAVMPDEVGQLVEAVARRPRTLAQLEAQGPRGRDRASWGEIAASLVESGLLVVG
ncbi:MAG: B12-binding domain-containing radical SAM protein [Myxococcales bacterium]|jgi:anaerobic magnesium-protoporphyrin IX monomethyl ester cyclase